MMTASSRRNGATIPDEIIVEMFARMDKVALGLAVGIVSAVGLFLATAVLVVKGGDQIGPNLQLLRNYIPWFSVTWPGSLVGAVSGFAGGFLTGWLVAFMRNVMVAVYVYMSAFWRRLDRFMDDM